MVLGARVVQPLAHLLAGAADHPEMRDKLGLKHTSHLAAFVVMVVLMVVAAAVYHRFLEVFTLALALAEQCVLFGPGVQDHFLLPERRTNNGTVYSG
jgi:hypothetical protein